MPKLDHKFNRFVKNSWVNFTSRYGTTVLHPQFIVKNNSQFAIKLAKKYIHGKLLDIGCGTMSYRKQVEPLVDTYVGLDYPLTSKAYKTKLKPDIKANAKNIPVADESFDSVLMLQVLEHIDDPLAALKEANRILKKGEYLILSTPFMYPIHDSPNDYFRYTQYSLKKLFKDSGFKVQKIYSKGSFLEFWLQSLIVFSLIRTKDLLWAKSSPASVAQLLIMLTLICFYPLFNIIVITLIPALSLLTPNLPNGFPLIYVAVAKKP
ncbi:MAG: Methyltransferase type 11 [Parcubacteria group bacterium GW2011_GWA1_38_7]|nr:MAG: Methyltransferase type 11 [Parcubacteria group bacterium GW2011_GWA1_38_7]